MQRAFKFSIALTDLHQVDLGKFHLPDTIQISRQELSWNTYSPIRQKYPNGITLKLSTLVWYSVSESDNIATDILLRRIGGPQAVEDFIRESGIEEISVKYSEEEQHKNQNKQFENWISPKVSNLLLQTFYENRIRPTSSTSTVIFKPICVP